MTGIVALCCLGLLAGCSDPKAANDKNFAIAIADYLKTVPLCTRLDVDELPGDYTASTSFGLHDEQLQAPTLDDFFRTHQEEKSLYDLGLMSFTITRHKDENSFGGGEVLRYFAHATLTDKGKAAYRVVHTHMLGNRAAFCYGQKHLVSIDNFTEPSNMLGQTVSNVQYTWQLYDVADWAKDAKLQAAEPDIKRELATASQPTKDAGNLVLTNKGWIHVALLK
ncbi:MAG: hypothetical protein JSR26_06230 [Proteobacteria bacterium]|nr:hypothetical protein [Pseudomonadota bacterium]